MVDGHAVQGNMYDLHSVIQKETIKYKKLAVPPQKISEEWTWPDNKANDNEFQEILSVKYSDQITKLRGGEESAEFQMTKQHANASTCYVFEQNQQLFIESTIEIDSNTIRLGGAPGHGIERAVHLIKQVQVYPSCLKLQQ